MSDHLKPTVEDLQEAAMLVKEIPQHSSNVSSTVKNLISRVQHGEFNTTKGINFLNVKSHMLLNYLINLTYLIFKKTSGKAIEDDPAIERLVELRTVLEKMRPIDQKLKYQIQKLIIAASTGNINAEDPLHFRANPENLMAQQSDESERSDDEDTKEKPGQSKVYVPPKIAPTFYEGDETQHTRKERLLERIKKRALNSNVLEELRREYDMGPEEIKEVSDVRRQKINDDIKDRTRYEEEYMLRLPVTKKQKHDERRVTTVASLHNLAKFDDISGLEIGSDDMPTKKKRNSKKFSSKKSKGKKKGFKRKRH